MIKWIVSFIGSVAAVGCLGMALLFSAGCGDGESANEQRFKVGTWKTAQTIQPFFYEQIAEDDTKLKVLPFTNPADQKTALLAGSLDMCGTTLAHAIQSASRGEPVVVVAALCNKCSALVNMHAAATRFLHKHPEQWLDAAARFGVERGVLEQARVLILHPGVMLMDEPFAALDYQTRGEMQDLLLDLWRRLEQTVVFVTHDIEEAIKLADTVLILGVGRQPSRTRSTCPCRAPATKPAPRSCSCADKCATKSKPFKLVGQPCLKHT